MKIFSYIEKEPERVFALTEDGSEIRLSELKTFADAFYEEIGGRKLVFLLLENTKECLLRYLSCLFKGIVPLLLDSKIDEELLNNLIETYRPAFVLKPGKTPEKLGEGPALNPALALLLTTSGSTGSPKLVRITADNLDANAESIVEYLEITEGDVAVTMLPMSYSYGMSVINSHMLAGAKILIQDYSVIEKTFWDNIEKFGVSSIVGVPFTYQMLLRAGIMERDLPALKYMTQAGGKLPERLHKQYAEWAQAQGKRFYVMYGQTEASPRMGYLPYAKAIEKCGSMGIAVPGGKISLIDDSGAEITQPELSGELVYSGANVSLGYATKAEDLMLGDEFCGVLHTGDMAKFDADGFYYITGRKKRFVKLYGNRVNLDQVERLLAAEYTSAEFACVGTDDKLSVYYASEQDISDGIENYLVETLTFPARSFAVNKIDSIPKNASGKTLYSALAV